MGIGRFIYTPILPSMIEADILNRSQAGMVAAFNYIGYLLGAIAASLSILGANRKFWLFAGLLTSALTTYLMASTQSLLFFNVVRFTSGVASAFAMIFVSSIVFDAIAKSGRQSLLAVHFSGVGLGITASALFIPLVEGWQNQWASGAVASVFGIAVIALLFRVGQSRDSAGSEEERQSRPVAGGQSNEHLEVHQNSLERSIRLLIFGYGLFGFGYIVTTTFISELARSVPELNQVQDLVWLIVGFAAALSTFICMWGTYRWGYLRTFAIACIVEASGVALSVLVTHPLALSIAAALLGGTFVGATAIGLMAASRLSSAIVQKAQHADFGRKIIALMTVSFGLGQVLGPWIAGILFEWQGNLTSASLAAALALILSGGFTLAARRSYAI